MQKAPKIIIGIDPGTVVMGYGILAVQNKNLEVVSMQSVRLNGRTDMYERLRVIHQTIGDLIERYQPHELAIEAPFFGKNVQSMLKLGRAQGVAIAVAMQAGIPVSEYAPRSVKQAITGNGNADKEQVRQMLRRLVVMPAALPAFDASDALAVAVCHHFNHSSPKPAAVLGKRKKGWDSFIREHPGRVRS